jgi:hypothetical protein
LPWPHRRSQPEEAEEAAEAVVVGALAVAVVRALAAVREPEQAPEEQVIV